MIGVLIILSPVLLFFALVKPTPENEYMRSHFDDAVDHGKYIGDEIWETLDR